MQEMRLIDAYSLDKDVSGRCAYNFDVDIARALIANAPTVPAVPLEAHEKMKRELNTEIEKQSQNMKMLVSDHRTLQQSFDNLKSLYEAEKAKVEKAKEKCIYFAKELQKARAETDRVTAIGAEWKDAAYTYADNIDRIKAEAIKEFAERLKAEQVNGLVAVIDIEELEKEMAGETDV